MTSRPARYNPAAAFDPPRRMPLRPVQSQEAFVVRDITTLEPAAAETGVSFHVGIPVLFHAMGRSKPSCFGRAFVRYIGRLKGEKGPWVGLEVIEAGLETIFPLFRDGTYRGVKYFELGEEDEHNWHSSRSVLEGERRRKSSGTSVGTSTATSESSFHSGSQRRLTDQPDSVVAVLRPCIFVRPADVVRLPGRLVFFARDADLAGSLVARPGSTQTKLVGLAALPISHRAFSSHFIPLFRSPTVIPRPHIPSHIRADFSRCPMNARSSFACRQSVCSAEMAAAAQDH